MIFYGQGSVFHRVAIIERDSDTGEILRVHERPEYTAMEAAQVAHWLNQRACGYPTRQRLEHLHNDRG